MREILIDRAALECRALGVRTIALYGAGLHTRSMGFGSFEARGLRVAAILDDHPPDDSLLGVPIMRPQEAPADLFDGVVISSDRYEKEMLDRIRQSLNTTDVPIIPIYAPFQSATIKHEGKRDSAIDIVGPLAQRSAHVGGDLAELGVFDGRTFGGLLQIARQHGKSCHAFDTFRGMPDPGDRDPRLATGEPAHPTGQFDIGGVEQFAWHGAPGAVLWPGLIPALFEDVPLGQTFCFVRLDLDNYEPTLAAARWAWPRMAVGACLTCHDYYADNGRGAAGALDEFLLETGHAIDGLERHEAWVFKKNHAPVTLL
jgi:Methyltransferase domain